MNKLKIIFIPICWFTELYYAIRYNIYCSGHSYVEQDNGFLICEVCGKISK